MAACMHVCVFLCVSEYKVYYSELKSNASLLLKACETLPVLLDHTQLASYAF